LKFNNKKAYKVKDKTGIEDFSEDILNKIH